MSLSVEGDMEKRNFSPIFPEKMTFKPLSPWAFYKYDSCFPLASDKQGLMCPCRETTLVGDESPSLSLSTAYTVFPNAALQRLESQQAGRGRMSAVVTWQQYLRSAAGDSTGSFVAISAQQLPALFCLQSAVHPYGRNCRSDWETLISSLSWGRPW